MTHEVVLQGYNVKPGSLQLGTFDSYGIEKIHVTADDEWAGLDILAVFHAPDGTATKVVVGANGMLAVPPGSYGEAGRRRKNCFCRACGKRAAHYCGHAIQYQAAL